ncbi:unknown [Clostridium sp. CAG:465]|nr:unknown [Clostridium sp. CAG:465]
MKKKTCKIIICISLVVMLFTSFGNVFGATNPDYTPSIQVSENALDSKIKSNILLDTLAGMINAIASLAEYLLGAVFKTLTGDNIFPWADRIIFNGIGFLDINFLNPASNSLFVSNGSTSILGKVVYSVYSTIFSLAVLFLGVAVGIMAIRLALSSIAAEKAKYKQAIVNWVTCIVMLFLMHYILAFVFWINEQLVQIASGILIKTIDETVTSVDFTEALNSVVSPDERVKKFSNALGDKYSTRSDVTNWVNSVTGDPDLLDITNKLLLNSNYIDQRVVYVADNLSDSDTTIHWWSSNVEIAFKSLKITDKAIQMLAVANKGIPRLNIDGNDANSIRMQISNASDDDLRKMKEQGYYECYSGNKIYFDKEKYLKSEDFEKDLAGYAYVMANKDEAAKLDKFYINNPGYKINTGDNPNSLQIAANTVWSAYSPNELNDLNDIYNEYKMQSSYNQAKNDVSIREAIAKKRLEVDGYIISAAQGGSAKTTDIIANLGQFFKQSAYTYTTEETTDSTGNKKETIVGWRATKLSVTGALLYAIFIFQSCMYFIMYVKRLFYVMMLSMFGPIVVIYDFFMKSAG